MKTEGDLPSCEGRAITTGWGEDTGQRKLPEEVWLEFTRQTEQKWSLERTFQLSLQPVQRPRMFMPW